MRRGVPTFDREVNAVRRKEWVLTQPSLPEHRLFATVYLLPWDEYAPAPTDLETAGGSPPHCDMIQAAALVEDGVG